MAQRVSNIYRLVTFPRLYEGLQHLLGGDASRTRFIGEMLQPWAGMKVLDVGCGPASLFPHLPEVVYTGIDLNPAHIAHARQKYGDRGRFLVGDVTTDLGGEPGSFDLVIVAAVLHHLSDAEARRLFSSLVVLAKARARIVTIDNVWLPRQNLIARLLNKLDSGLNVRTEEGYLDLLQGLPVSARGRIYRDLLRVPYDHFCMELTKHHPA